jgi:hypothetical protein
MFVFQGSDALRVETVCRQEVDDNHPDVELAAAAEAVERDMQLAAAAEAVEREVRAAADEAAPEQAAADQVVVRNRDEVAADYDDQRPRVADDNLADAALEDNVPADGPPAQANVIRYDESTAYFNMRYVGSVEASWRLLGLEMWHSSHSVVQLAIHDENDATVTFRRGQEAQALERRRLSTLEAFMLANAGDDRHVACTITYLQSPEYFTRERE